MRVKLYANKRWLRKKYVMDDMTEEEIAELCNVDRATINRYLRKFELKR